MDSLETIGPLDGRYRRYSEPLGAFWSEAASMKYKIIAEGEYLIALSEANNTKLRSFTDGEKAVIRRLYEFTLEDATVIRDIEFSGYGDLPATNHDFKAIEYFIKEKLKGTSLTDCLEWVHFGLTSEDAGNMAYGLMLAESIRDVYLPALERLAGKIGDLAMANAAVPMLARTHGQPASPTTFGKEFRIFHARLLRQIAALKSYRPQVKLNGATGNYNALVAAYPDIDWIGFSREYIARLAEARKVDLEANIFTTQIEPHDSYAELFDLLRRVNTVLISFDQDMWRYVSDGWILQNPVAGEIGSSTMPHKINPWFLENSEGNLGLANALYGFLSAKLPVSRLQRDLSDSTVLRNIGVAFGHSLIGFEYLDKQLGRIAVNREKAQADLEAHPEVLAEAIQTVLRRDGLSMPYEKLKDLTRGKNVSLDDMRKFIRELDLSPEAKAELLKLTPSTYTGLAAILAETEPNP